MLTMPSSPQEFARLCMQAGVLAVSAGLFALYRGFRRVNPSDIIEGMVTSVRTDQSGNNQATIQYTNRKGAYEKCILPVDYYPSLGETVPLILRLNNPVPKLHVKSRISSIIWGVVLLVLGLVSISLRWILPKYF